MALAMSGPFYDKGILLPRHRLRSQILGKPKDQVVVHGDMLSLVERPLTLAGAAPIRQIAPPGIQPLGRTIVVKESHSDASPRGASGDQEVSGEETWLRGASPCRKRTTLCIAIPIMRSTAARLPPAIWGVTMTWGRSANGLPPGRSSRSTSSPAPASLPLSSACRRAASSTSSPRAVLMRSAPPASWPAPPRLSGPECLESGADAG